MGRLATTFLLVSVSLLIQIAFSYDPESRLDLVSRFSGYNFSSELILKEGSSFLCPTTFLTSQRAILHERILGSILDDSIPISKPTLFVVIGASGSGKSYLINSLVEGTNPRTCPFGRSEDIGEFLFDGPKATERKSFQIQVPKDTLTISGDDVMVKLPGMFFFYFFFIFFFFFTCWFYDIFMLLCYVLLFFYHLFLTSFFNSLEYTSYQRWLDSRPKHDHKTIYIDVANSCHLEAAQLAQSVALTAVESRIDLVFEGTGQRTAFLFELASLAIEHNYTIHLIHVNTDLETCAQRAAKRFEETGRGVPFDIVKRSYLLSRRTFRQVASLAHFASVWRMGTCTQGFFNPSPRAILKNPIKR